MADVKTWTLAEQRALWRELTGRPSTGQISDVNVNKEINDYYVHHFSHDAKVDEFNVYFTENYTDVRLLLTNITTEEV